MSASTQKQMVAWRGIEDRAAISPALLAMLLGAALVALLHPNAVKAAEPATIRVLDFGTYGVSNCAKQQITDKGGDWYGCGDIQHLTTTRTVVAALGTRFGFRFDVHSSGKPLQISLRINLKFPSPGVSLTGSSKPTERDSYTDALQASPDGDAEEVVIWNFGLPSHLVPGIWTFEVWDGEHILTEQVFNVVFPPNS